MRLLGILWFAVAAILAAPLLSDRSAAASCVAPTVTVKPARVARGGVLTVTGQHFGEDCFDTGTVPPGVGPLGQPLTGLVVVIDQGDNEFVVATGSAGSDYAFKVDVVVPASLEPGKATLALLGAGDARLTTDVALTISGATPAEPADATVATFGPPPPDTEPDGTVPPPVLPADIPDEHVATVPTLSTTPAPDDTGNVDGRRAVTVGIAVTLGAAALGFAFWSRAQRRG